MLVAAAAVTVFFLARPMAGGQAVSSGVAQMIYQHKCAVCHGSDGEGHTVKGRKDKVKPLSKMIKKYSVPQMVSIVEKGKGAYMDSFSDELKPPQIDAVVEFYRSLCHCVLAKK
jgi:mono/diheme cytochrome c family protein